LPIQPNPLEDQKDVSSSAQISSKTQTVPARTVFHEANAALRNMITGIQTQEQLDDLINDIEELQ
jgi:hypothetical protein